MAISIFSGTRICGAVQVTIPERKQWQMVHLQKQTQQWGQCLSNLI